MGGPGEDEVSGKDLEGLLDGLQAKEKATEAEPPPGTLAVQLHGYQKRFLSWALDRESASQRTSGGILADEQGLGKTVQMLALILSHPPTEADARRALRFAEVQQRNMVQHVLRDRNRNAAAAQTPAARQSTAATDSPDAEASSGGGGGSRARKAPTIGRAQVQYKRCSGGGPRCTCVMCNRACDQERKAAVKEVRKADRESSAASAAKRQRRSGGSSNAPARGAMGPKSEISSRQCSGWKKCTAKLRGLVWRCITAPAELTGCLPRCWLRTTSSSPPLLRWRAITKVPLWGRYFG